MKNIRILPTDNPSRLYFDVVTKKLLLQERLSLNATCFPIEKRNIYITNDEEIKDEDWTLKFPFQKEIFKNIEVSINEYVKRAKLHTYPYNWCQKIILTTDPDLIKDGVQAIDDEFLKWFVKNLTCKFVEVKWVKTPDGIFYTNDVPYGCYKIIIPKEVDVLELGQIIPKEKLIYCKVCKDELVTQVNSTIKHCVNCGESYKPEQETIEEARANSYIDFTKSNKDVSAYSFVAGWDKGVKWQKEQDKKKYSEEEVIKLIEDFEIHLGSVNVKDMLTFKKWFEQLKKNNKMKITNKLPDGVLWEKAREYSKEFTSFEKPVQSAIAMNAAQDHYYRGMIALRDMIEKPNDEAINLLDGLVSDVGNLLCDVADLDFEWQQCGYYESAKVLLKRLRSH